MVKQIRAFEFSPQVDSVRNLDDKQLTALLNTLIDRNVSPILAHHFKESVSKVTTKAEIFALADGMIEQDQKVNTDPLFVVYSEGEEEPDPSLSQLFARAIASGVGDALGFSTMTINGQRTPTKPPTTTYRKVASSTRPGHVHTVELVGGVPVKCSCEGFFFSAEKNNGAGYCKHLKQARP